MPASIEDLLGQEILTFNPVEGTYDVERVAAFVEGLGFPFRDEADPSCFVISSDEPSRDVFQARRRADPASLFPPVLRVIAKPDEVVVFPAVYAPALRDLSQHLLEWLDATYRSRITDDFGNDLTEAAGGGGMAGREPDSR